MDAGVDVLADDGAEFAAAGVDEAALDHGTVVLAVVTEIRGDGARAEVDVLADDGVADVGEVPGGDVRHEDGVLDFDGLPNVAFVGDEVVAAQVAVRADLAVLADHGDALDVDAGEQHGAFAQDHHAVERDAFAHGAVDDVFGVAREVFLVDLQQIPRIADAEGRFVCGDGDGVRAAAGAFGGHAVGVGHGEGFAVRDRGGRLFEQRLGRPEIGREAEMRAGR